MSTKALQTAKEIKDKEEGLVLPPPPVPSQVRMGTPPPPPTPTVDGTVPPEPVVPEVEMEEEVKEVVEKGKETGKVTVHLYVDKPYKVEFEGHITGEEVSIVWRALFKQYRLWKHNLSKMGGN